MNERIKELINEATSFKEGLIEGKHGIEVFDKEKFAELIVWECSQIAHNSHPDDLPFVGGKMLVHFGVEELALLHKNNN